MTCFESVPGTPRIPQDSDYGGILRRATSDVTRTHGGCWIRAISGPRCLRFRLASYDHHAAASRPRPPNAHKKPPHTTDQGWDTKSSVTAASPRVKAKVVACILARRSCEPARMRALDDTVARSDAPTAGARPIIEKSKAKDKRTYHPTIAAKYGHHCEAPSNPRLTRNPAHRTRPRVRKEKNCEWQRHAH